VRFEALRRKPGPRRGVVHYAVAEPIFPKLQLGFRRPNSVTNLAESVLIDVGFPRSDGFSMYGQDCGRTGRL
jgi:hypothetical protein